MKPKQNLKRNQARKNYGLLPDRKIEKQSKKTQERWEMKFGFLSLAIMVIMRRWETIFIDLSSFFGSAVSTVEIVWRPRGIGTDSGPDSYPLC